MDVLQRIPLADVVDKLECLREVVKSVEEDEVDHLRARNGQLGKHIHDHQTRETKGGGLEQVRKRCNTPSEDICTKLVMGTRSTRVRLLTLWLKELKLSVEELKMRLGEDNFRQILLA